MDILRILLQKNLLKKEDADRMEKEIQTTGQKPEELLLARRKIEEALLVSASRCAAGNGVQAEESQAKEAIP